MKVLIADDDPMWRKLLSQNVQKWGYEVATAEDGQQAWDILQERGAPRVAILDWQMPELDGVEICRRIRSSLNLPFIYTIILTSRDTRDDMVVGFESGADDYLVKPVDLAILRSRLTAAARIVKAVPPPRQIPGYQLLGRLGAGAMATVYKARQLSLDRLVAVKILPKKFSKNPEFVERFYAEGRAAAKLNHPNIVAALDVGRHGDAHYFIMEYVEGHTVHEHLIKEGPYPEANALAVTIQVAKALNHAHQAGLIHRDVKPKNILIASKGLAKLADMGLARAISDREAAEAEAGKAFGTPYYISPEQIRGIVNIDLRADIYNLGATLYHMVTGRPPFEGPDVSAILMKHLDEPIVPPDHINPALTNGICEIVELCMAKDPAKRYATTTDLIEDLEAVAEGRPPVQAHKLIDLSALTVLDQKSNADESAETQDEGSLITTPLFWIAVVGWFLVVLLLIIVIMRAN
ncbi:MAG: protein kinase domain-containing protein [Planctomycetota bacterium]|jgi:serine/threonine-protein kinase